MEDKYGSVYRESMKRVMERPAQYRRTNVREPQNVRMYAIVLFAIGVLAIGVGSFYLMDKLESRFRNPVVQR